MQCNSFYFNTNLLIHSGLTFRLGFVRGFQPDWWTDEVRVGYITVTLVAKPNPTHCTPAYDPKLGLATGQVESEWKLSMFRCLYKAPIQVCIGPAGLRAECDLNSRRANMNPTLPYLIQSNTWMLEGPTWTHSKPDSGQMLYPLFGLPFKKYTQPEPDFKQKHMALNPNWFLFLPKPENLSIQICFFQVGFRFSSRPPVLVRPNHTQDQAQFPSTGLTTQWKPRPTFLNGPKVAHPVTILNTECWNKSSHNFQNVCVSMLRIMTWP